VNRLKEKVIRAQQQNQQAIDEEYYEDYTEQQPGQPTEEDMRRYYQQRYLEESKLAQEDAIKPPLAILDEIKEQPSPKGTLPVLVGGRPVDLHVLEDYIVKISPHALKTILRYHNARTIEEIKNYSRGPVVKSKGMGFWILIIALIGIVVVGIMILMFAPELTSMMKNFIP